MKLSDINNGIVRPGCSRTVGSGYETEVPMTQRQIAKNDLGDDQETEDLEGEVEDLDKQNDLVQMSNSWAPFRDVPNIKKIPNTANLL